MDGNEEFIRWFEDLDSDDVPVVGGKNASLGEMIGALKEEGLRVPDGFATTARAYWTFVDANEIEDRIRSLLSDWKDGEKSLQETGEGIRRLFRHGSFPQDIAAAIRETYAELGERYTSTDSSWSGQSEADVAVRSSATAEDLPEASFAGQQETFLNVTGEKVLLEACRKCYASLFTDRAITYREEQSFDHMDVALSVGVQKM